jgi:predicted membrane chloride channel (bestrophin family)
MTLHASLSLPCSTNASYSRFDEARKLWGLIVNKSRDLVRLAEGYLSPNQSEIKAAVARWTVAYT